MKFDYKKVLNKNLKKHIKEQQEYLANSIKDGYPYTKRDFKWQLPYFKRSEIFKQPNGRVTFDPKVIEARSYGHWCFVKVIKGKVVFNDFSYSNTTGKHQSSVRSLMQQLGIKVDVFVNQRSSLSEGIRLDDLYRSIEEIKIASERKGARKTTKKEAPKLIQSVQKQIADLKKLGGKLGAYSLDGIKQSAQSSEKYRLERVKAKREQWKLDHKLEIESKKFDRMIQS
jgi:hypothetical protein